MAQGTYPVIAVFDNPSMAEDALEALNNAGFTNDQIRYSGSHSGGGFLAGLKSLFTGEDESAGHIDKDLQNIGVPQDQADYYANEHYAGHPVLAVLANGREQEVMSILRSSGGYNYNTRQRTQGTNADSSYTQAQTYDDQAAYSNQNNINTAYPVGQTAYATDQATYNQSNVNPDYATDQTAYATRGTSNTAYTDQGYTNQTDYPDTEEGRALRLREERLQAEKQQVQSGEVRLHKDVVEEEKNIDVPVTHEEVFIERRPVAEGRVSDTPISEEETIRVPVSEEQVNVTKTPVETGEVAIGKRAVTENQRFSDTVRREEARVESDDNVPVHDNAGTRMRNAAEDARDRLTNRDDDTNA